MDEYPADEIAANDQHGPRKPRPRTLIILAVALLVAAAVAVWSIARSSKNPPPSGSASANQAEPVLPLETRVERTSLQREALEEMLDAPATTVAWAVSLFGFRPPELAADEPWDPPTPQRVLSIDDPGPVYTSFVRNIPVPDSEFSVDESIDLTLDDDGETVIAVQYARFTDAPVENADRFLQLPE